jgi:site-specific DNA recombinase
MLRAVGYARVSTEEQAREGLSLPDQVAKMNAYARLYEIQLVGIELDEGISAKKLDRPGVLRSLAMIDTNEADGLLVTKLDRLSRSLRDWNGLIDDYFGEKPGKKLWSVSEHVDTTTASGRMMLNMLMLVAQWEREVISERTRDGLQYRIRTGSRTGKVLYGKAVDPADPRVSKGDKNPVGLMDEPAELAAISLMVTLRQAGSTYREIATDLTRRGIPTRDGGERWDHSTVRKILKRA